MANNELLDLVMDRIKSDPDSWNQANWRCGTTFCFAGHVAIASGWQPVDPRPFIPGWEIAGYASLEEAQEAVRWRYSSYRAEYQVHLDSILNGLEIKSENTNSYVYKGDMEMGIEEAAAKELGINDCEADLLFAGSNDMSKLTEMVEELKENGEIRCLGNTWCPACN